MRRAIYVSGIAIGIVLFVICCSKKPSKPGIDPDQPQELRIDSLSSYDGWPEDTVSLFGGSFGEKLDSLRHVRFGDASCDIIFWTDHQVDARVPGNPGEAYIILSVDSLSSNSILFTINGITSVKPAAGLAGDTVAISGYGFGDSIDSSSVTFAGVSAEIVSWSDTVIVVLVPEEAGTGQLQVNVGNHAGMWEQFYVTADPVLLILEPDWGPWGSTVNIHGQSFGEIQGSGYVLIAGELSAVLEWADDLIVAEVPDSTETGLVTVVAHHAASNSLPFRVFWLSGVTPSTADVGDTVLIIGREFGVYCTGCGVYFGTDPAHVISWSDTLIEAVVQPGNSSGAVTVSVDGIVSNSTDLHITAVSEVLDLLHQTTIVKMTLSGLFVLEDCSWSPGCGSHRTKSGEIRLVNGCYCFCCNCDTDSPLAWNGNKFSSELHFDGEYRNVSFLISGEVSTDGSRVVLIDGQHDSYPAYPFGCPSIKSILTCHNIELFELAYDESRLSYRATGKAVQQLVDEFYKREKALVEYGSDDPMDPNEMVAEYTTYKSLIWDSQEYPPVLLITFEKE